MDGILLKDILYKDYADELIELIRSGGDIDEFIQKIESRQRQDFIETDVCITSNSKQIKEKQQQISTIDAEITRLEREKQLAIDIKKRVDEIKAAYPKSRQDILNTYLESLPTGKTDDQYLTAKPKGLINKIRYGKSIENGNKKLEDLLVFCEQNGIKLPLSNESFIIKNALSGHNIDESISHLDKDIDSQVQKKHLLLEQINESENRIQTQIRMYDSNDSSKYKYAAQRKEQRKNIAEFCQEYSKAMQGPASLSSEEVATKGLSEEYIERQIMESKYPEKNLRSIRRSYEGLDRPAAPVVAFGRDARKPNFEFYETKIADDVYKKLQEKGFDVVFENDPRAIDPNVFVVDRKAEAIYAPFLSPQDALKANIQMVDAIYECEGEAARSSPRTRETFSIATHTDLSGKGGTERIRELDLETVACHYSKENYERVMNEFVSEFIGKSDYTVLHNFMEKLKKDNPEKHTQLANELYDRYIPYRDSQTWNQQTSQSLARDFMTEHKDEFIPYIKKSYQDTMLQEAFEKGMDAKIFNQENMAMLHQNKAITSVFHAGQTGGMPYSILGKDMRMCHIYGSIAMKAEKLPAGVGNGGYPQGVLEYAFGQSSHDGKKYNNRTKFGFVYEYESRGDKQEIVKLESTGGIEISAFEDGKYHSDKISSSEETAVLPHQNKLKKVYIAVQDTKSAERRVFPLELDKDGNIADKRWRDFIKLHNPVDDTLEGLMVERQNNMIADYDLTGKEKMMDRHLIIKDAPETTRLSENLESKSLKSESKVVSEGAELAADATVKTAAAKAATTATEKGAKSGVIETIKAVDDKVNTTIDKTIEKGSKKLNNTAVGKAYTKAEKAVANSTVGKAVNKGMQKVGGAVTKTVQKTGEAVAKTAAGKAVQKAAAKTVGKTAAKAVGKSVLKKIPLVSVGAGLVFGAQRAMAGDWKGAAGEVASGALGTFPGLGTAASVAIDAGLAGRDIYNETKKDGHNADSAQSKKSNTSLKKQLKTDAQKAKQYTTKQKSQKPQQHHTNTKSLMKTDAKNAANKYQHQMEALINSMNKVNGKNKAIDAEKTTEKLYQKYGDNAYALLQEAVQKPSSYINALNNNSIKTSSDVVNYLCNMENTQQNQQIIRHILSDRGR